MNKWMFRQFTELTSRKWISRLTGSIAQSSVSKIMINRFARLYQINVDEAEKELKLYASLNDFFTRKLKSGARPIDEAEHVVISPVDALITAAGPITEHTMLNVKGQDYSIRDLLQSDREAERYNNGYFYVLYLSPQDYHRIHTPVAGNIIERKHLPGKVYPVNDSSMTHMKQVLNRNERVVTILKQPNQNHVAVVKVGALNVSSINYVTPEKQSYAKGEELAYFAFGSTVVLLFEADTFEPSSNSQLNTKVKMGERLGQII